MNLSRIKTTDGSSLEFTAEEFCRFRNWLRVEADLDSQISALLWFDMYVGYTMQNLNCWAVLRAMKNLESGEPDSGVKTATCFKHPPLEGLWHKHYFSGSYLSRKLAIELSDDGIERIAEHPRKRKVPPNEEKQAYLGAAMKAVLKPLAERSSAQKLTGEWLIFAKCDTGNLYLSLGFHDSGDQFLYDRIAKHCVVDFPILHSLMG